MDSRKRAALLSGVTRTLLKRWLLLYLLWLVISAADARALIAGMVVAGAGAWLSIRLLPSGESRLRLWPVIRLMPAFAWRSLLGGMDVAWRALHPRMPLVPGWMVYRTRLPRGAARVTLGNEISLTPGTLAAGGHEEDLYVHYLDSEQPVATMIAREEHRVAACIRIAPDDTDE